MKRSEYGLAVKNANKALKRVEELVVLRAEKNPDYKVLLSPFAFLQGDILVAYIQSNQDLFGNIAPLDIEVSEDSELS